VEPVHVTGCVERDRGGRVSGCARGLGVRIAFDEHTAGAYGSHS
jgi:hypothetical protein